MVTNGFMYMYKSFDKVSNQAVNDLKSVVV